MTGRAHVSVSMSHNTGGVVEVCSAHVSVIMSMSHNTIIS